MFLDTPYFGIIISILFFELGILIQRKTKIALLNPLIVAITAIILILTIFNIDISSYNKGGDLISFFLGPATVILAVPLYKQLPLLKKYYLSIICGITIGSITSIISVIGLSKIFSLEQKIVLSSIPKSVTTPIGVEIAEQIGGIPALTVGMIIITGIIGAVIGPLILKTFKIKNKVAVGAALGTASHALGTTKAIELGETEGALSSLAIGLAGLITVILVTIMTILI